MKRIVLMVCLCLFLLSNAALPVSAAPGQEEIDYAVLDAAVIAQIEKHGLPGVSLAVVVGDEIVYLQGYGTAGSQPMTPQTQMFIGSQSKSLTALVIAQLAEQGRIELQAPVQEYIPWFRVADEAASARITVNHLLHHTSGLSDAGFDVILPADASLEDATRALAQARLTAPVGKQFQYFNLGYGVLTYLIELVTGQPYADYLQVHVLAPLGMENTTADPSEIQNLSTGHTRLFGFAVPMSQPVRTYEIGAGYIVSTAEDMARYALAIKDGAIGLLSPEMYRLLLSPGLGAYGMGWHIVDGGGKIFHGGANETFATHVSIYPKTDRAFVLLINEGHQMDHFISSDQLMRTVEAIVLGKTPPPISEGWSMRWIGWGFGLLVLGLLVLHTRNFYTLFHSWKGRARQMPSFKLALDVAISFLIPTVILVVVFSQIKAFYGMRFNLLPTLVNMRYVLPDITILMLVGSLPDYVQGLIKLMWIVQGRTSQPDRIET
ncbi:MAG: serine hydrolase [Anaerolineales bacterium]|nr:serine hydrolase [Anaerolineales bacterium]